jgi:hypothetical protein
MCLVWALKHQQELKKKRVQAFISQREALVGSTLKSSYSLQSMTIISSCTQPKSLELVGAQKDKLLMS